MSKSAFTVLLVLLANACFAQSVAILFKDQPERYFSFQIRSRSELSALTKVVSLDKIEGNTVFAYASQEDFEKFLALPSPAAQTEGVPATYQYEFLPHPSSLLKVETTSNMQDVLSGWDVYPTYQAYLALMDSFVAAYPHLCTLHTIGTLPSGRKILALKISDNPQAHEDEPQFLYTSSMHGDETAGYPGMLHLIDYLLSHYGTDLRCTHLIENLEIWINPLANPDGTYRNGNNSVNGATRGNANNVDLNRNFPDFQNGNHPDGKSWQPETLAFMAFADSMHFVMGANFHGGSEVLNYPWDTWSKSPADEDWWIKVCNTYADTAQHYGPAGYLTSVSPDGVTNGYEWYEVNGGRQDYMNYFHHCREQTIELSNQKLLATNKLLTNWEANYRSWLGYMEEALRGIRGIVRDTCTGLPLVAKVEVVGHDVDNSFVFSAPYMGNFHRVIQAGTYDLRFSAPGYFEKTIENVTVEAGLPAQVVQVALAPKVPCFVSVDDDTATGNIQILPNPTDGAFLLDWRASDFGTVHVAVFNAQGSRVFYRADVLDKTLKVNGSAWADGVYFLKLEGAGKVVTRRIVIGR